jgi:predicted metal-dependent hydrolase
LSADRLTLPRDLVDYVICHDLVHLKIPDHGPGFRALMGCHMPDWQERRQRLARWVIAGGQETDTGESIHTT